MSLKVQLLADKANRRNSSFLFPVFLLLFLLLTEHVFLEDLP